jgi:leucyl/phenylalanyl-tRNA--protein transferase
VLGQVSPAGAAIRKAGEGRRRGRGGRRGIDPEMPVYRLDHRLVFPSPDEAEDGLLAVGGDLRPERLLIAYSNGIFPWYGDGLPILWHSPDPRMVLEAGAVRVGRSLRKRVRRGDYEIALDRAFVDVVRACARTPRPGQRGTWITGEMIDAYVELHRLGFAHSAEAWQGGELCGGLYGVSLGGAFFGESMFARRPDASKVAFVTLVAQLARWDIDLVDCQVHTEHLERFGATEWPRRRFLAALEGALTRPTRRGQWALDPGLSA